LCCSSLLRSLDAEALSNHDLAQSHDKQQGENRAWNTESVSLKMGRTSHSLIWGSWHTQWRRQTKHDKVQGAQVESTSPSHVVSGLESLAKTGIYVLTLLDGRSEP
jgi:hypothetical protein